MKALISAIVCTLVLVNIFAYADENTDKLYAAAIIWDTIKDSKDPSDFEKLIKNFPDTPFADLAKKKLEDLKGVTTGKNGSTPTQTQRIAQKFLMDGHSSRIITVKYQGGTFYKIAEYTSPWKWEGVATLDGDYLLGQVRFLEGGPMRVEGFLRTDGSIKIDYHFLKEEGGMIKPTGRIDKHVWIPAK